MNLGKSRATCWSLCLILSSIVLGSSVAKGATIVRFTTVMGSFDVQLFDTTMPRTVQNFLSYVNADRYDGTVIHRNSDTYDSTINGMRDFVIQGGGYTLHDPNPPNPASNISYTTVQKFAPIADEPGGGVYGPSNAYGTIAMAKSGPNTVTSEWFFNQGNNSTLDNPARPDGGFAAFGMVLGNGMNVVNAIGDLTTPQDHGFAIGGAFGDLPLRNFTGSAINQVRVANTVTVNSVSVINLPTADFDRNGMVNQADLAIFRNGYGMTSGAFLDDGDADMDGDVDGRDFLLLQRSFGQTVSLGAFTTIPEPSSVCLFIASVMALATRRSRR